MQPSSLIIEILVALMTLIILLVAWRIGQRARLGREAGFKLILSGFGLLFLGALVDISDHFPELSRLVILGRTPAQAFVEKIVGFLGGFLLIAIGLWRWLPRLEARDHRERTLQLAREELEVRVAERTAELSASTEKLKREVDERRQAEELLKLSKDAAEEANRAKSQFLANMSHELRTPLNSVIGFSSILRKNKNNHLNEQETRYLTRIHSNGEHLLHLINEVLDLERIESGRMEIDVGTVDLKTLIEDVVSELRLPQRPHLDLRSELPQIALPIRSDAMKLKQILLNLVGNGLKFTDKGHVTVHLDVDSDNVPAQIRVSDTGIGIPRDRLDMVFEAFQQLDASKSRRYGGTGLGLSISDSLCKLLGFRLEAESEEGQGSTFTIRIQNGSETGALGDDSGTFPPAELKDAETLGDLTGKRVLVVDDNVDARLLLSEYLAGLGCRPILAASGEEALFLAEKEHPDLITLDLMMPEMDGWQVLTNLKNKNTLADIPVVVVSILAEEKRGTVLGAVDALSKPVSRRKLARVLRRTLSHHPSLSTQGPRILIVDDEPDQRLVLSNYLEDMGFTVDVAENGREALATLEHKTYDLLLVDLVMPIMDGPTLLQQLRRRPATAHLPVAVITSKQLSDQEKEELGTEVSTILSKGGTLELELRRFIDDLWAHKEAPPNG